VGQLPFDGEAVGDLLVKLCTAPLPIPSQVSLDVPPGFDAWFTKALSREPQERFATANELADALANVCGLPVRGSFSTGDIPIPSFASGPMAASGNRLPAVVSVTPYPSADGSGPHPAAVSAGVSVANTLQMATGAPTTQTPPPIPAKSRSTVLVVAAAAVVVLGVGLGIALKMLGDSGAAAQPKPVETSVVEQPLPPAVQTVATVASTVAPILAPPIEAQAPPPSSASAAPVVAKPVRPPPQRPLRPARARVIGAAPPSGNTDVGF
jgi:serine/threonine-protein kinase